MTSETRTALVIDGKNVLFQYGAVDPRTAATSMIDSIARVAGRYGVRVCDIHLCWEATDNFRVALFPDYKATRPETDLVRECVNQCDTARSLMSHTAVTQWSGRGGEGDDVVATVARRLRLEDQLVYVWSTDGDMRQLVTTGLKILSPNADKDPVTSHRVDRIYDEQGVERRTGVAPLSVTVQKALMGDSGDNVPGIPLVGEKTAAMLANKLRPADVDELRVTPAAHLDHILAIAAVAVHRYEEIESREATKVKKHEARDEVLAELCMTERIAASIVAYTERARLALQLVTLRDIEISGGVGSNDIEAFRASAKRSGAYGLLSDHVRSVLFS